MNIFLAIFTFATWSSVFPLGKLALSYAPPIFLTGVRMLLASGIILSFLALKKRSALKLKKSMLIPIALLAVLSIYLTNICEFWGLQHLSAAKTCFIYGLSPFIAAILSYIHFGERLSKRKLLGMLIGFAGFIPVLTLQSGSESLFTAFSIISWPELAIMGAAFFSMYGWVLLRILVKDEVSPLTANGYSMLIGGGLALVHSLFVDQWAPIPLAPGGIVPVTQGVVALTLISNVLSYNLYGYMLKRFTATFLSFVGLLSPIFASLSSWVLLGERPSWIIFAATGVVSIGLFIIYQAELKQGYIVKKGAEGTPAAPAEQEA